VDVMRDGFGVRLVWLGSESLSLCMKFVQMLSSQIKLAAADHDPYGWFNL